VAWPDEHAEPDADGWVVRLVPGAYARKPYRCPGCEQEVLAGQPHVVVWREATIGAAGGVDDRRHWHTACWQLRGRRRPTGRRRPRAH